MFRVIFASVLTLAMAGQAFGDETATATATATATTTGDQPGGSEALEIMRDHMRSQLDWRSYFTNRLAERRRERSANTDLWQQPRQANAR